MELTPYELTIVPIIVALVRVLRMSGVPPRWLPLCAIALGMISGFVYIAPENPKLGLLSGIVMGLIAIGVWSSVTNTIKEDSTTSGIGK
ncbi:MAG: hypothetical protein WDZ91_06015 [Paenibacillaceae bacterium]